MGLLQEILQLGLSAMFPNTIIALHIFVSLPASLTSGEHIFNVLNQVKNYHCSTMGQGSLNGRAMLNINYKIARRLDFISLIDAIAQKKARKAYIN